jgi:tetratricopeptide (TPR) repeat protein
LLNTLPPSMRDRKLSSAESRAAEIQMEQENYPLALATLTRVIAREERSDSDFDLQPTLLQLTICALKLGDVPRAHIAAERSMAISLSPRGIAAHRWGSLFALAQVQRAEGDPRSASTFAKALSAANELGENTVFVKRVEAAMRAPIRPKAVRSNLAQPNSSAVPRY